MTFLLTGAGDVQSLLAQLLVPVSFPSDPSVLWDSGVRLWLCVWAVPRRHCGYFHQHTQVWIHFSKLKYFNLLKILFSLFQVWLCGQKSFFIQSLNVHLCWHRHGCRLRHSNRPNIAAWGVPVGADSRVPGSRPGTFGVDIHPALLWF